MKYIIIIITLSLISCATPCICPDQDIYIMAETQEGEDIMVMLKKGMLNDPDYYMPADQFEPYQPLDMPEQRVDLK